MIDLGRRYWIAKENQSPRLLGGAIGIGLVLIGAGYFAHRDFVTGLGCGLVIVFALAFPVFLRRKS